MIGRRMTLMQPSRSQIKNELDDVLEADYNLLRHSHNQADDILHCQFVHRTPLIKQYIEQLEHQYNIPSPLKQQKQLSTSKRQGKRLELSMRNSAQKHHTNLKESKQRQRLTLVSNQKPSCESLINQLEGPLASSQKETPDKRYSLKTPKFGIHQKPSDEKPIEGIVSSQEIIKTVRENMISRDGSQRVNYLQSKQKPRLNSQSNIHFSYLDSYPATAKKKSSSARSEGQSNELSLSFSYKETPEKRTVKKETEQFRVESESSVSQFNSRHTILHKNPVSTKRVSRGKIEAPRLQIQDSYRYCVGCEDAILSANIKHHESMCEQFKQLSVLPNEELLLRLKQKVAGLQVQIPKSSYEVNPQQVQQLRRNSINLVEQSKRRPKGSPESPRFSHNYSKVMNVGHKWCSALQQINKLRWFTRILSKLESMIQENSQ